MMSSGTQYTGREAAKLSTGQGRALGKGPGGLEPSLTLPQSGETLNPLVQLHPKTGRTGLPWAT
jgi:hypothetical protein